MLVAVPYGVVAMSAQIPGLVETSTNLASVRLNAGKLLVGTSQRSCVASALEWVCDIHRAIARLSGASIEHPNGYPGWKADPDSKLLKKTIAAVTRVTGRKAAVQAIHAGLECGIIKEKYDGMDAVSIGPTVEGGHSPSERVNIESVETFWEILLALLDEISRY